MEQPAEQLEQQRLAEEHVAPLRQVRDRRRQGQPRDQDRDTGQEAGQGAGSAHVEQLPLGGQGRADADERAQRADADGQWKEVRQRRVEVVPPAGPEVRHLVGQEDEHERQGEAQAGEEDGRVQKQLEEVIHAGHVFRRDDS